MENGAEMRRNTEEARGNTERMVVDSNRELEEARKASLGETALALSNEKPLSEISVEDERAILIPESGEKMLKLGAQFLSETETQSIEEDLRRVKMIESFETIEAQENTGKELSLKERRCVDNLSHYNVRALPLTPKEAENALNFVNPKTPEDEKHKLNRIGDKIERIRHDYRFLKLLNKGDQGALDFEQRLAGRYKDWEAGTINTDYGFDIEACEKRASEETTVVRASDYDEDYYYNSGMGRDDWNDYSDSAFSRLRGDLGGYGTSIEDLAENYTRDELLEDHIIEPEDYYEIGPFTEGDLNMIGAWDDELSRTSKDTSELGNLLKEIIDEPRDLDEALLSDYIRDEILTERRPNPKNLVMMTAAACQGIIHQGLNALIPADKNSSEQETFALKKANFGLPELNKYDASLLLRKEMRSLSNNLRKVCGWRESYVSEHFGSRRTISEEFFGAVLDEAKSWTDRKVEILSDEPGFVSCFNRIYDSSQKIPDLLRRIETNKK